MSPVKEMGMLKNAGLRTKMLLVVCGVVLLSYGCTIWFITVKTSQMAKNEAQEKASEIAYKHGGMIKSDIDNAMDIARTLAHTFEGMKQQDNIPDRAVINSMLKQVLKRNPNILAIDTCWEPNTLDGKDAKYANTEGHDKTGRFAPYWNRGSGGIAMEPLVNFDNEEWYIVPKQKGKEILMNPYVYPVGGKDTLMATVVVPIMRNSQFLGMVGIDIILEHFSSMISEIKPFQTGYGYLVANNGYFVAHPAAKMVGKNLDDFPFGVSAAAALKKGEEFSCVNKSTLSGKETYHFMAPFVVGQTDTPWGMVIAIPMERILKGAHFIRNISVTMGVVGIAVMILVVFFLFQRIVTSPINTVVKSLKDIAEGEGDLTQRLPVTSGDEIGILSSQFNVFVKKLQGMIKEISSYAVNMSGSSDGLLTIAKDLSEDASDTNDKSAAVASATDVVAGEIKTLATQTADATSDIRKRIDAIQGVTDSAVTDINDISQVITQVNEIVTSIATAVEEQSSATKEIANNTSQVSLGLNEVNDSMNQNSDVVSEISKEIAGVNSTASQMSDKSSQVHSNSKDLSQIAGQLKAIVEKFKV